MDKRTCMVAGCDEKHYGRDRCRKHYDNWYRAGKPAEDYVTQREKTPWERFWEKVDATGDCWEWTGALSETNGDYGVAWDPDARRTMGAHRRAWILLLGPLDDGLELDHMCKYHRCVNPDHLQPVTHAVNVRRGAAGWNTAAKTHCPQGHPYEGDNLFVNKAGGRVCVICKNRRSAESHARRRAAAA